MTSTTESADDDLPAAAPPLPRRSWSLQLGALAIAAGLAVAVIVAVVQSGRASDLAGDRDDLRDVRAVSAAFGEAYLTYDFNDVEASGTRILAMTTAQFAASFERTQAPGLEALFANIQTTTDAQTKDVFVGDIDGDRARALVVVDVRAGSTATGEQVLTNLTFVIDLVRDDGEWKVDAVAPAPQPDIAGGPTTGTTPTTAAP